MTANFEDGASAHTLERPATPNAFNVSWEEEFFLVESSGLAKCLIWHKTLQLIKKFNIQRHYSLQHATEYDKYVGTECHKLIQLKENVSQKRAKTALLLQRAVQKQVGKSGCDVGKRTVPVRKYDSILKALSSLENANIFLERTILSNSVLLTICGLGSVWSWNFLSRRGGSEVHSKTQDDNNALSESAMRISYKMFHEIAKELKTFNEGDFIKRCLIILADELCPQQVGEVEAIRVSRRTVVRRLQYVRMGYKRAKTALLLQRAVQKQVGKSGCDVGKWTVPVRKYDSILKVLSSLENANIFLERTILSNSVLFTISGLDSVWKTVETSLVEGVGVKYIQKLREEQRLRVFENKVLRKIFGAKRDEVTGEWRKLHNAELHALHPSPDIIRNINSRRLRWAGHVAHMGESRNAYRVLVGRPEGKRPLGRPRRRWEDNIKMDLREITVHVTAESRPKSHSAECAPSIMAVGHIRQHLCLTWGQATKGNNEGEGFGPVLWIEFGVTQWSERLVRRTKDPGSIPGAGANFSPRILIAKRLS
ncbi:hypothetical protein ANN_24116 [Periplaneta americana]|uniref:Uncharacterized protein n=1 Tax=Periplaneta americana TaxID=6978 RepID=A0ABQ8S2K1_PERAM|nr:hypothetical protein ANN_24116 [Periplaneta americana]